MATYVYDARNHRIKKTVGDETRLYYFNQQWQCVEERVGTTVDATWIYGLRYIDDVICRTTSNTGDVQTLYALQDPNWNVVAVLNSNGSVAERLTYDSFGKPTFRDANFTAKTTSLYDWTKTFTGQVYDAETGLMLYRNRYYHPTLGRFITRDPIGYNAGDANLYRYAKNRSCNFVDADGLIICPGGAWEGIGEVYAGQVLYGRTYGQMEYACKKCYIAGVRRCKIGNCQTIDRLIYKTPVVRANLSGWLLGVGLESSYQKIVSHTYNASDSDQLNGVTRGIVASGTIGKLGASASTATTFGIGLSSEGVGVSVSWESTTTEVVSSFYRTEYDRLSAEFQADMLACVQNPPCKVECENITTDQNTVTFATDISVTTVPEEINLLKMQ